MDPKWTKKFVMKHATRKADQGLDTRKSEVHPNHQTQMGYIHQNQGQETVRNSQECYLCNEFATRDDVQRSHQQDDPARSWGCRQECNSTLPNNTLTVVSHLTVRKSVEALGRAAESFQTPTDAVMSRKGKLKI